MDEDVGVDDVVGDDEADLHVAEDAAVAPQEGEGVQVDGALHHKTLQFPEKLKKKHIYEDSYPNNWMLCFGIRNESIRLLFDTITKEM